MSQLSLAVFLIVFGLNILFGLRIPIWVIGLIAVFAGVAIAMRRFGFPRNELKQTRDSIERNR
jgi:hypothetical protein